MGEKAGGRTRSVKTELEPNDSMSMVMEELKKINKKMDEVRCSMEKTFKEKIKEMGSSLEKQLNSKIDSLRDSILQLVKENQEDMKAELQRKFKEIQDNMDMEIGHLSARIDQMEINRDTTGARRVQYDPDVSIIVLGLPFEEGEDVMERVKKLLSEGLRCDPVPAIVAVERMKPRGRGPGLIKVEMNTTQEKVAVLRRKMGLKDNETFSKVYIRSAKSHAERLIDLNFRTILEEIPSGKDFFITGNGRVIRRGSERPTTTNRERRAGRKED